MEVPTWAQFWAWVQTPAGLGIGVVAIVGLLKRLDNEKLPAWLQQVGKFIVGNAMVVSVVVALVLSALVFFIQRAPGVQSFFEEYFVIVALAWAVSQAGYATQKAGTMYYRRLADGQNAADAAGTG